MNIFKLIILFTIFISSSSIGYLIAGQYKNRVDELKELKNSLNVLKTKMKYTYETIPDIFEEISKTTKDNVANIFRSSIYNMETLKMNAGKAWRDAITNSKNNLVAEDKTVLINLEKLLGKTDLEGQVGEIEMTCNFLDLQIEKAEKEKAKNEKLYKTLGNVIGITIVILLV